MALADEMPLTAAYVAEKRAQWGAEHVKAMVAGAMQRKQRNCFWAVERVKPADGQQAGTYRTVGEPFDRSQDDEHMVKAAMMYGLDFYGLMQPPAGWKEPPREDGQVGQYCRLPDRPAGS